MISGTAAMLLCAGCATPVTLAPVGPNPAAFQTSSGDGQLEVFSALSGHVEGNNPTWYRYSDYEICNERRHRMKHVQNSRGYYSQQPRVVTLSAGRYIVKARAVGAVQVNVPVVIKPGELTAVHLDARWNPDTDASGTQLVKGPADYPVGWRADP